MLYTGAMPIQRLLNAAFFLALPLLVAAFDLSLLTAIGLLILGLLWRQLLVLSALTRPRQAQDLVLETIQNSHFAEKGRWCLDRLGVDYREKPWAGVIGVLFRGRTVPLLIVRTGRTLTPIGDSSHMLRYLYGRYVGERPEAAAFLEPTPKRLDWERRLDAYGTQLQVWIYHHLLKDPALCKQAWGAYSDRIPAWQRWSVLVLYPVLEWFIRRSFQPDEARYAEAVDRIETLLAAVESELEDGRDNLLDGGEPDFVDITLASLSALWVWPEGFAGGRYDADRPSLEQLPAGFRSDRERWRERFPRTIAHVERLYAKQRTVVSPAGAALSEPDA